MLAFLIVTIVLFAGRTLYIHRKLPSDVLFKITDEQHRLITTRYLTNLQYCSLYGPGRIYQIGKYNLLVSDNRKGKYYRARWSQEPDVTLDELLAQEDTCSK